MSNPTTCDECEFESVKPKAKFMFSVVFRCTKCNSLKRHDDDTVEHTELPSVERELLTE